MFITLLALWVVRVPASYYLSGKMGIDGVWWAIPTAWFIGMSLSYLYYLTGKWKTKGVIRHSQKPTL